MIFNAIIHPKLVKMGKGNWDNQKNTLGVSSAKLNPLNGDVSDSQLNARGGQNDHALKYI